MTKKIDLLKVILFLLIVYLISILIEPISLFFSNVYYLLLPFIVGLVLAYIVNPFISLLERKGIKRKLAVLITVVVFFYIVLFIVVSIIPTVIKEFNSLKENMPIIIQDINGYIVRIEEFFNIDFGDIDYSIILKNTFSITGKYINVLFLSPMIMLYFLFDYNRIKSFIKNLFKGYDNVILCLKEINAELTNYFKGVLIVMLILSFFSTVAFYLVGLDYPLLFGVICGVTNIIPLVGPYIGGAIAIGYALTKSIKLALIILLIIMVFQTLESNFLTPFIQSRRLKKHPLLIILSFVVFSRLFGFLGMLLSLPLLSIIICVFKYVLLYRYPSK